MSGETNYEERVQHTSEAARPVSRTSYLSSRSSGNIKAVSDLVSESSFNIRVVMPLVASKVTLVFK